MSTRSAARLGDSHLRTPPTQRFRSIPQPSPAVCHTVPGLVLPVPCSAMSTRSAAKLRPFSPENVNDADIQEQTPASASNGKRPRAERVFTDEDEILLLESFWKATNNSVSSPAKKVDPLTIDKVGKDLGTKFTKEQVSDKLRKLRAKYQKQSRTKSCIKTPHDHQIHEIGRKIWGKRKATPGEENGDSPFHGEKSPELEAVEQEGKEEGGVGLGKFPALVDMCETALEGNGALKQVLEGIEESKLREMNYKFVMLKYEEAALMKKKAEMIQELTSMILDVVAASARARV